MKKDEVLGEEMNEERMLNLLADLADTEYFVAIQKFNRIKDAQAIGALITLDAFKDPTKVAKAQGIHECIYYMEQTAVQRKEERKKESEKDNS